MNIAIPSSCCHSVAYHSLCCCRQLLLMNGEYHNWWWLPSCVTPRLDQDPLSNPQKRPPYAADPCSSLPSRIWHSSADFSQLIGYTYKRRSYSWTIYTVLLCRRINTVLLYRITCSSWCHNPKNREDSDQLLHCYSCNSRVYRL